MPTHGIIQRRPGAPAATGLSHLPALARRCGPAATLSGLLDALEADLDARGLDVLNGANAGDLARPRRFEMAAALNRLRTAAFASEPDRGGDGSF